MENSLVNSEARGQANRERDRVSPLLAGLVVAALLLVFLLAGLIINKVYFERPVVRTALERDLLRYQREVRANPKDVDARVSLADVYLEMGEHKKARDELGKARQVNPRFWAVYFEMGLVSKAEGNSERALSEFAKAATIDPLNDTSRRVSYYQIAMLHMERKRYRAAIAPLKKVIEAKPIMGDAHYYLGYAYEKTGDEKRARQEYQEALKYIPGYAPAVEGLERVSD